MIVSTMLLTTRIIILICIMINNMSHKVKYYYCRKQPCIMSKKTPKL